MCCEMAQQQQHQQPAVTVVSLYWSLVTHSLVIMGAAVNETALLLVACFTSCRSTATNHFCLTVMTAAQLAWLPKK